MIVKVGGLYRLSCRDRIILYDEPAKLRLDMFYSSAVANEVYNGNYNGEIIEIITLNLNESEASVWFPQHNGYDWYFVTSLISTE